jgi:hypothetical protein
MVERLTDRIDIIEANGGYPAEGFGFDLNGFAGAPGPRFGPITASAALGAQHLPPFASESMRRLIL